MEPLNSGFSLVDPSDPRHQYITAVRKRFGEFLHKASTSLSQQGEENTVDAVQMLVRPPTSSLPSILTVRKIGAMRTYMLEYGDSRDR